MRLARFVLILSALLAIYCLVMLAILVPWAGVAILIGVAIGMCRKSYQYTSCGSASWAAAEDLRNAGMLGGHSLMLGYITGTNSLWSGIKSLFDDTQANEACEKFFSAFRQEPPRYMVRMNKSPHATIIAPTNVGKTSGIVIPFLKTNRDNCVVIDFKGELALLTAEDRRKMGHRIVILDPFEMVTKKLKCDSDTLNVVQHIDKDSPFAIDDCRDTAAAIIERKQETGDGVHFLDTAEGIITSLIAMLVAFADEEKKSLQSVCDLISKPNAWTKTIQLMTESQIWDGILARMGGNLLHLKEREFASSMSTVVRFLGFLSTPAIAACTRSSSFDPAELVIGKMTVYVVFPPDRATAMSSLLRLWVSALLRAVLRGGLQEKKKVHFVCDEASTLGKLDQISQVLAIGRSYGIRMQLYYQDLGQIKKCWPDGADQTLLANTVQVFFGVNDPQTAEFVSSRLGDETVILNSGGIGSSRSYQGGAQGQGGSSSYSMSSNDNWGLQARRLLKPEEVTGLSERIAVILAPGLPPIWTTLVRYYETGFRNNSDRFWSGVKAFIGAAILFASIGAMAVLLTKAVDQKYSTEQPFPIAGLLKR